MRDFTMLSRIGALQGRVCRVLVAAALIGCASPGFADAGSKATVDVAQSQPAPEPAEQGVKPASDAKSQEPVGTPATVIDGQAAESLLGKKVESEKSEDLGRIVDVIVDKAGLIRAAVIDFGGFLGVGSRKIAVDWRAIRMPKDGKLDKLIVALPQDQLRSAPVYKEGEPVVVLGPASDDKAAASAPATASPPAK